MLGSLFLSTFCLRLEQLKVNLSTRCTKDIKNFLLLHPGCIMPITIIKLVSSRIMSQKPYDFACCMQCSIQYSNQGFENSLREKLLRNTKTSISDLFKFVEDHGMGKCIVIPWQFNCRFN